MFYAIVWIVVAALLALWSSAAWALHAVGVWTVSSAGALNGAATGVDSLRLPQWLAPWVPPEIAQPFAAMLADLGPLVGSVLQGIPALAQGVSVLVWLFWGIGALLLIALGAVGHVLIVMWHRQSAGGAPPTARVVTAG